MSLDKMNESNMGGAYRISIVKVVPTATLVPDAVDMQVDADEIVMVGSFEEWKFKSELIDFNETAIVKDGVTNYTATCSFDVPKDRPDVLDYILGLMDNRYLVMITFNNTDEETGAKMRVLMGSHSEPAMLVVGKRSGGKQVVDYNGNVFTWVTEGRKTRCPFVV
jgi:hypothetical protein